MKITRKFTKPGQDVLSSVEYEKRTSRITNPDGSVVFEMRDAEIPRQWSQLAADIMVSKYFRKAGVPQMDESGKALRDTHGNIVTGPEKSVKQVVHRLAGCWRYWGEKHGYFDSADDAQAFYDELAHMLLHQMCAPNSPQWFNTGLNFAYGITGPSQGHYYCDPRTGELMKSKDAYTHPQPHACFIQSVTDDLVNSGGIMDLWTREARLFKYGSGTGSNFSKLRGDNEPLSGGGKSSGLMSFLKIGDRAAGAIKSGGTTRRAAKMVCLDLDHPDIEQFVNWKVREELKVAAMAEGIKVLPKEQRELAKRLGMKLDYDFNGESYQTVSGQNSNNSVRIPNRFFKAVEEDANWNLTWRTNGKLARAIKATELWAQICFAAWRCADPGVQYDDTINQWHTCPRSGRINASNPCITGDTRVLTPGGIWRRIDQMIHLPTRVITNLAGQEIHVTEGAFPTGMRDVFELRTAGGYSLKLTADHKVWTRRRGWVEAQHLTLDDEVRLPSRPACVESIGEPQDPKVFQLVGLHLSEANNDPFAVHLEQCLKDSDQIDTLAHYAHDQWGQRAYEDDYVNDSMVTIEASSAADSTHDSDTLTFTLTNRRLLSRLSAFIRIDNGQRRLSDETHTTGLPAQKHILRAIFSADAIVHNNTLELHSSSPGLLEDIQVLLLGFGVQSSRFTIDSGNFSPNSGALPDRRTALARSGMGASPSTVPGDAASRRHGLRIDSGSLRSFGKYVGLMPGKKLEQLAHLVSISIARPESAGNFDRVESFTPVGRQQVFDLTEPQTQSFIAAGITIHNCSEYMFLDDTACNLASLNVLQFFDAESRRFDAGGYQHAIRLWTIVLEVSVLMASFPSEEIARLSYKFRTLGLGYANLGAMLMQAGIPYDSEKGRAICAALSAILTGESYATSAELARELGAFPGYEENKADMLRVIRNHRRAAYDVAHSSSSHQRIGDYEGLDIRPVGIDASQFADADPLASRQLQLAALESWDRALTLGERHGYRNAQTTVIAPTGTIGLLMDCDTTGVEPDFALVKFKKLAGGGYFKIANQSLQPALRNLGYSNPHIHAILQYVMGTLTLDNAPHINRDSLKLAGFTNEELEKVESALPGVFELSFAFSAWSIGAKTLARLGISESEWMASDFNLLSRLGFTRKQITEANDVICGRGTIEGAPDLKPDHLPVFDCANRCGRVGRRFINVEGHIRMMAAAQPFISGAISKTINLPNEATIEDIKNSYFLSWQLGLKANALYRDGSKLSQPLNVKSDEEVEKKTDADDEGNVNAAREELANDVALAAVDVASSGQSKIENRKSTISTDNLSPAPMQTVEKIIERIVERPLRRRLPDTRNAKTHKFDVAGHEGYITVGLYDDGSPGEVFITMAKEGSTIGGLMDTIATLISVSLQYGVPVESLVRKFEHVRFEPSGMTRNSEIPIAKSLIDYIFRWLAMEFVPGYRAANAPKRSQPQAAAAPAATLVDSRAENQAPSPASTPDSSSLSTQHSPPGTPQLPSLQRTTPAPRSRPAPRRQWQRWQRQWRTRKRRPRRLRFPPLSTQHSGLRTQPGNPRQSRHHRRPDQRPPDRRRPRQPARLRNAGRRPRMRCLRLDHGAQRDVLQVLELREFDGVQLSFQAVCHASGGTMRGNPPAAFDHNMSTLEEIRHLPQHFIVVPATEHQVQQAESDLHADEMRLYDPLTGVLHAVGLPLPVGVPGILDESAKRRLQEAEHYADNIAMLMQFMIWEATRPAPKAERFGYILARLQIDFEKILTDIRSFLDPIYQVVLARQPEPIGVPHKKRASFGQFCEWYEKSPCKFAPPLALMAEIVPWALTVRKLRDNYVHHGHKAIFFTGDPCSVSLLFNGHTSSAANSLPQYFYLENNPNKLIRLDKFLVYLAAPVFALRIAIGEFIQSSYLSKQAQGQRIGLHHPFQQSVWIKELHDLFKIHGDVLAEASYQRKLV